MNSAWLRSVLLAASMAIPAAAAAAAEAPDARRPKKLIATGWDKPDSRRLRENLEEMEKRPFDGVVLELVGQVDQKKQCRMRSTFADRKWEQEWFQPCIENLRACKFRRLTDNFLTLGANPGNVDWFDEQGWANIVEHWRIAARVARQSGLKGILFDPEPYTPPYAQFGYAAQPEHEKHSFDDYYAKARQRGRQVMEAVAKEHPDVTLFCYFLNSVNVTATGHADPRRVLAGRRGYGLLPAFLDGWLDAAPPSVTFVDGCESAYRYNSPQQYLEAAVAIKGACQELVSPENRAKYRAQVQVSFGVYLDAYWNPKDSEWGRWYIDGQGGPRVERLRANVEIALRAADEYVWIYGEKFRWWPTPNGRVNQETWPEALPGCEAALRFARDPVDYARTEIARLNSEGKLANLARNGDFAAEKVTVADGREDTWREGRPPAGWNAWQGKDSQGTFTWDRQAGASVKGSARAAGAAEGCFIQSHDVRPGQRYAVRAVRRLQGRGTAHLRIRWQTAEGRWTLESQDKIVHAKGAPQEWHELLGVVQVPEGAGRLVILLGTSGQASPEDVCWYDDVELCRLD